jgi:beta-glucosidase
MYLGGQAVNSAAVDLLLGRCNPSGKLAETWPLSLQDTPCYNYFPGKDRSAEYRESIFVGYRYYDRAEKKVLYPFGYGLSYTTFSYANLKLNSASFKSGDTLNLSFTVKNTGNVPGAEIAQVYVALKNSKIFRPVKELKGFEKVFLQANETKAVSINLDTRSFAYYNAPKGTWALEGGEYEILVGPSSRELPLRASVQVSGDGYEELLLDQKANCPEYFDLSKKEFTISDKSFEALYVRKLPPGERNPQGPFDRNSTLSEIKHLEIGKKLIEQIHQHTNKNFGVEKGKDLHLMIENMLKDMPLRGLTMMSGGILSPPILDSLIDVLNGKPPSDPALLALLG